MNLLPKIEFNNKKIIRVFPKRTSHTPIDNYVFIGDPPMLGYIPPADEIHVSVIFTWDIAESQRLYRAWATYFPNVKIGGPAFGSSADIFTPGLYLKSGITITTRGCNNNCWFCRVPKIEGRSRIIPINDGHIIQDNNLLQAPFPHIVAVIKMLRRQKRAAVFSGGLDATLMTTTIVNLLKTIRIRKLFFAYDFRNNYPALKFTSRLLRWLDRRKKGVYVLVGHPGDTPEKAERRLREMYDLDYLPYAMAYRSDNDTHLPDKKWSNLVRRWRRPIMIYNEMIVQNKVVR